MRCSMAPADYQRAIVRCRRRYYDPIYPGAPERELLLDPRRRRRHLHSGKAGAVEGLDARGSRETHHPDRHDGGGSEPQLSPRGGVEADMAGGGANERVRSSATGGVFGE